MIIVTLISEGYYGKLVKTCNTLTTELYNHDLEYLSWKSDRRLASYLFSQPFLSASLPYPYSQVQTAFTLRLCADWYLRASLERSVSQSSLAIPPGALITAPASTSLALKTLTCLVNFKLSQEKPICTSLRHSQGCKALLGRGLKSLKLAGEDPKA